MADTTRLGASAPERGPFDLPAVGPIFEEYAQSFGLGRRLRFYAGNFFDDALPQADAIVMGHILHDWDLEQKRRLLDKAYAALPGGGALIVYESSRSTSTAGRMPAGLASAWTPRWPTRPTSMGAACPQGHNLDGVFDFMRITRGTMADAKTTIDELYAWEFHGPFLYDFTSRKRPADGGEAGAIDD